MAKEKTSKIKNFNTYKIIYFPKKSEYAIIS